MKLIRAVCVAALLLPVCSHAQTQGGYGIEDFIKKDRFQTVKISPKGTYIAATVPVDDKTVLVVFKPGETKPYGYFNLRGKTHVMAFEWVNDQRILFTVGERDGALEEPRSMGEIWGMNADGSRTGVLVGWQNVDATSGRAGGKGKREPVAASLIDGLHEDDQKAIISVYRYGTSYTSAERMDVNSGARIPIAQAPVENASFLTDNAGQVRFAYGAGQDRKRKLYFRKDGDTSWQLINDEGASGIAMYPLDFSADNATAYIQSEAKAGTDAVMAFDTTAGTSKVVAQDPAIDPDGLVYAVGNDAPIGVSFTTDKVKIVYFDPASPDARLHRSLQGSFGGDAVAPVSVTKDGKSALLLVHSDRNPGDYYLFDTAQKKADLLISRKGWFDPNMLARTKAISYQARDGRTIHGLLTVPPGSSGKQLPLIVNPHGGPFGIQDQWGYGDERQMLAAHGYAVLQVNYRGSSGYGREFTTAGYKQWGLMMQDDLTDATRWVAQQGIADPQRICIYGASYGGYASLMGAAKEPALYKCAVGYVGVYDLALMKAEESGAPTWLKNFFKETLNPTDLAAVSPNKIADRIKVPVFLAAGGEDKTADIEHTRRMEKALAVAGVPVETLYYPTEGHGFYTVEHNREYYARLLTFLSRHIGGKAPTEASANATAASK